MDGNRGQLLGVTHHLPLFLRMLLLTRLQRGTLDLSLCGSHLSAALGVWWAEGTDRYSALT